MIIALPEGLVRPALELGRAEKSSCKCLGCYSRHNGPLRRRSCKLSFRADAHSRSPAIIPNSHWFAAVERIVNLSWHPVQPAGLRPLKNLHSLAPQGKVSDANRS
ncbi:hypothetical protein, partial [Paraburkholderia sp. RL17-373-BIF-A]|uniref:hypothetical protein n=1 Tax=Paraburkholderia sp. RL17-373-BIF-A TaxID=3031629 RepID=UPI0038B9F4FD